MCLQFVVNAPKKLPAGDVVTSRKLLRCIIAQVVNKSSAPEDGQNYRPKLVELIEIINKFTLIINQQLRLHKISQ